MRWNRRRGSAIETPRPATELWAYLKYFAGPILLLRRFGLPVGHRDSCFVKQAAHAMLLPFTSGKQWHFKALDEQFWDENVDRKYITSNRSIEMCR